VLEVCGERHASRASTYNPSQPGEHDRSCLNLSPILKVYRNTAQQDAKPVETFLACDSKAEMEKWKNALTRALRSFHKQRGAAPTLTKEEKELHTKSIQQLRVMLEYLGVDFDKKTEV